MVGGLEGRFADAVLDDEGRLNALRLRIVVAEVDQGVVVDVNFLEDRAVQLIQLAHAIQSVEEPRQCPMPG